MAMKREYIKTDSWVVNAPFSRRQKDGRKQIELTDFERHVVISLLETALNGWEGNQARQNAAQRVIDKLR